MADAYGDTAMANQSDDETIDTVDTSRPGDPMTRDEQYLDLCRRLDWHRGGRPCHRRDLMIRTIERQIADLTRDDKSDKSSTPHSTKGTDWYQAVLDALGEVRK